MKINKKQRITFHNIGRWIGLTLMCEKWPGITFLIFFYLLCILMFSIMSFCLFDLILYVPSTIFQL